MALHGYQPEDIRIAGTPQWDAYFRDGVIGSREEFCRRIGADPSLKLITLTTTPLELYGYYEQVIETLMAARDRGRFGRPAQLLVRVHPRDAIERYAAFEGRPGRDRREAVQADRAGRRRHGGRRDRRRAAPPGQHHAPQRRGRAGRVDDRD